MTDDQRDLVRWEVEQTFHRSTEIARSLSDYMADPPVVVTVWDVLRDACPELNLSGPAVENDYVPAPVE